MRLINITILFYLLFFIGCKPNKTKEVLPLSFWHTYNANEAKVVEKLIIEIKERHQNWKIKERVLPFSHAQREIRRALTTCTPSSPDVLRVERAWVANLNRRELLLENPVDEQEKYLPISFGSNESTSALGRYFHPASVDGLALLYNRSYIQEPPKNFDELLKIAKEQTLDKFGKSCEQKDFDVANIERWGFFVRADAYWFLPFFWGFGGTLFDNKSNPTLKTQASIESFRFYRDLVHRYHISPFEAHSNDYHAQLKAFGSGQIAMIFNGPWSLNAILKTDAFKDGKNLGIARLPIGPRSSRVIPTSSHGYVISRCAKHPALAKAFIQRLNSAKAQKRLAIEVNILPALKDVYQHLQKNDSTKHLLAFQRAIKDANPRRVPLIRSQIFDDFTPALQAILFKQTTIKEAINGLSASWIRLVAKEKTLSTRK